MVFFLCVFHILEEERVLNDNAITTVASYWSWLHGCVQGYVAIQVLFERLASVGWARVKAQEVQT